MSVGGIILESEQSRRRGLKKLVLCAVAMLLIASGIGFLAKRLPSITFSPFDDDVAVDETYVSPQGTSTVRVAITDEGALGWGAITVYECTEQGDRSIWYHDPAVAEPDSERLKWLSEVEFEVRFVDPHAIGEKLQTKRIVLGP